MPFPNPETQFIKGKSGNPSGGSRKQRLTSALIKLIEEKGLDDPFVRVGMKEALKGDFKFWAYIFDRIDGKMKDKVEVEEKKVVVDRRDRAKRTPRKPASDAGEGEG